MITFYVYLFLCIRSVANMSVMTVTGTVFGPGMETSHNPGQGLQRQGSGGRGGRWSAIFGEYIQEFIFSWKIRTFLNASLKPNIPPQVREAEA